MRLGPYEEKIKEIQKTFFKFWHYRGWLLLLRPPTVFFLITGLFIFYFGLLETRQSRLEKFKWVIASVAGVSPDKIQYIGSGWMEISAERKSPKDKIYEPVKYKFNPFGWLFSSEVGFFTRWEDRAKRYVTYPLVYNERGEVWINKEGGWQYGQISGKAIKWSKPQRTGINRRVTGHEISVQGKELQIIDK